VNLVELLLGPAGAAPDTPALRSGAIVVNYGALADRAARDSTRLRTAGVKPGDRVAISAPNSVAFVAAYLGILHAGGVAVPLNPLAPEAELRRELDVVDASAVALADGSKPIGELPAVIFSDAASEVAGVERAAPATRADVEPAALLFTSGTAGAPRAAILTHGNLASNIHQVLAHPGLSPNPEDVGLGVLPFFHVFGLNVGLGVTLASGASIVPVEHFDPVATLELIERHQISIVAGVPTMFRAWSETPGHDSAFNRCRLAVSGAAALLPETAVAFRDRFGIVLHQGYGLTEASPIVTTTALTPEPKPGSIGPPLPGVEVRLVDAADGGDVLEGDWGELWVRGANVFPGYWNDDEATKRVLTDDGWLRTGDVAAADHQGELALVDRAKDLIIVSGFNVFPAEVEDVLREHADVADVAVVGEPSEKTGETVVAYMVPESGRTPDPDELRSFVARQLARYKCPTRVEIVGKLPRTLVGKVLRRELRDDTAKPA